MASKTASATASAERRSSWVVRPCGVSTSTVAVTRSSRVRSNEPPGSTGTRSESSRAVTVRVRP